jgi:hypothetical protein
VRFPVLTPGGKVDEIQGPGVELFVRMMAFRQVAPNAYSPAPVVDQVVPLSWLVGEITRQITINDAALMAELREEEAEKVA